MALDHNDQRAANFTSGAVLNKNISKVVIPTGKNAEILESVRDIIEAGVKDIYGDSSDRKYQKIVNLIMKRLGAKLEDSSITTNLKTLSESVNKDFAELKKELKALKGKAAKSSNESAKSDNSDVDSLLDDIHDKIVSYRKEQQKQLNELKTLIKGSAKKATAEKKTEPKAPKEDAKVEKEQPQPEIDTSALNNVVKEITAVVNDLKFHVEFALDVMTSKIDNMNGLVSSQFQRFDVNFQQIQTQLTDSFQQNTKGFESVNDNIKATTQNILAQIQALGNNQGNSGGSLAALPGQLIGALASTITTALNSVTQVFTAATTAAIAPILAAQSGKITRSMQKCASNINVHIDEVGSNILTAIEKSNKIAKSVSDESKSKVSGLSQILGRMRKSIERRVRNVNSLVNRWGKKNSKKLDRVEGGLFKKIFSGIGSLFKLILGPIGFVLGGVFSMISIIFKPLTWLLGLFKSPAILLFMVGALIFLWPYISEFISGWWDEYIAPAFSWIFEQVGKLWDIISTAVSEWWTKLWAPYGGFTEWFTTVAWPKVENFFMTVVWPFITEKVWPFIKDHWKGILVGIGIFAFLKNPMSVLKLALNIPILLLRGIQAAIAVVKVIGLVIKGIQIASHALIAAMPAIIAALPFVLVGLLVVALVAAVVAAFCWFTEDSYEDLAEKQEKIFQSQKKQAEIDWQKNIKEWTKTDYQSRFDQVQKALTRIDANTLKLIEIQTGEESVQEKMYDTGIDGMSATGAELQEMMQTHFSAASMREDVAKKNGGKAPDIPTFEETLSTGLKHIDHWNVQSYIDSTQSESDEDFHIPQWQLDRYNNLKVWLNEALVKINFFFEHGLRVAENYAKDITNWDSDGEVGQRISNFRQWYVTAKDKIAADLVSWFSKQVKSEPTYIQRWYATNYNQGGLNIKHQDVFDSIISGINNEVWHAKAAVEAHLKELMISPKMDSALKRKTESDIDRIMSEANKQFENVNTLLKDNAANPSGVMNEGRSVEDAIKLVEERLGKDSAFGKSQGYGQIQFAQERMNNLDKLKRDATAGLYGQGELDRRVLSKGSVDEKYITQLQDALVTMGSSADKNGVLTLEDKMAAYNAVIANVQKEFESTDDEKRKKRLGQIERALRRQLESFNEENKKQTGKDVQRERRDKIRKDRWEQMTASEREKFHNNFKEFTDSLDAGISAHFEMINFAPNTAVDSTVKGH